MQLALVLQLPVDAGAEAAGPDHHHGDNYDDGDGNDHNNDDDDMATAGRSLG